MKSKDPMRLRWYHQCAVNKKACRKRLTFDEYVAAQTVKLANKIAENSTPILTARQAKKPLLVNESVSHHIEDSILRQSDGMRFTTKPGYVSLGSGGAMRSRAKGHT